MNRIFVYGTLRQAGSHSDLLGRVHSRTPGRIRGRLLHLPPGYPALVEGDGWVQGEVVEISDFEQRIDMLDDYEGYDPEAPDRSLYQRVRRQVHLADGSCDAWTYVMPRACAEAWVAQGAVWVPLGDWLAFLRGS